MKDALKIEKWVEKKPMILIRFDEDFSESLHNSRNGFEYLTIAEPHWIFEKLKLPTLCLLETIENRRIKCYLATAIRKEAVSTFDTRLTLKKLRAVKLGSLPGIDAKITDTRLKNLYQERCPDEGGTSNLTPKLSANVIRILSGDSENHAALETALSLLPGQREITKADWAQMNAIKTALASFGLGANELPSEIVLKKGTSSELGILGAHLYEDNVVRDDAMQLPNFKLISSDVTGRAQFEKGDEHLTIYTANKLPLEEMLGVDLIYINETRGNIVMIQYKMLEENEQKNGSKDWIFRPDRQLSKEIERMSLPPYSGSKNDYRLSESPFYFKFVKRKIDSDTHQSFLISLDHLKKVLSDPKIIGPRGGICMSYNTLEGTYLRESDILGLIRSGYIGTHREETKALSLIIEEAARGNRAVVLAWQKKIREESL